jgi:hypothetical protein
VDFYRILLAFVCLVKLETETDIPTKSTKVFSHNENLIDSITAVASELIYYTCKGAIHQTQTY